jgi:hypothetical protein
VLVVHPVVVTDAVVEAKVHAVVMAVAAGAGVVVVVEPPPPPHAEIRDATQMALIRGKCFMVGISLYKVGCLDVA